MKTATLPSEPPRHCFLLHRLYSYPFLLCYRHHLAFLLPLLLLCLLLHHYPPHLLLLHLLLLFMNKDELGVKFGGSKIPCLVCMDDGVSFAEEYARCVAQQETTLHYASEFTLKHKLDWGQKKCQTMEVRNHRERRAVLREEWRSPSLINQ